MEESREDKLRRWLEEKKANLAKEQQSALKRGAARPLETPKTAARQQQAQQPVSTAQKFSRFGSAEGEQQTPLQGARAKKQLEQKTPTGRSSSSAVNDSSVDKRRALLQRTTLSSAQKPAPPSASSSRSTTSRSSVLSTPSSVTRGSARKQLLVDRGSMTSFGTIDMGDVAQLREQLMMLEHAMLQWSYATARLERAAEKQQQQSERELRAVWGAANEERSRALAGAMEEAKQRQARLVQDQLRSQCAVLLPGAAEIEEFVRNFSQLSDSVASTLHALPVASECNEEELSAALREVSEEFSLLPESAPIAVQTGDDLTKTASTVREELDALLRCRELLISLELKLAQKHSAMIDEIESKNELAK